MNSIKAVFFDVGGVLTSSINQAMSTAARLSGIDLDRLAPTLHEMFVGQGDQANPAHDLECGKLSFDEFADLVGPLGNDLWTLLHPDSPHCMYHHLVRSEEMNLFVDEVRAFGLRVGIVSNVIHEWLGLWHTYTHPIDRFDTVVYSCIDGLRKPHPAIFHEALHRADLDPSEVIYLDDGPAVIETARAVGMTTVLVEDHAEAITTVRRLIAR